MDFKLCDSTNPRAKDSDPILETRRVYAHPTFDCDRNDSNQGSSYQTQVSEDMEFECNSTDHKLIESSVRRLKSKIYRQSCSETRTAIYKLNSVIQKPFQTEEIIDHNKERKELLESQRKDTKVLARNKRMFVGMLMGTLHKFKVEETDRIISTAKRFCNGERGIQEQSQVEQDLFNNDKSDDRLASQSMIIRESVKKSDAKLDVEERYKNWDHSHFHLSNYIRTETKPRIFWLPKMHNRETELKLRDTKDYYNLYKAERTARYRKELSDIDDTIGIFTNDDSNRNKTKISPKSRKTRKSNFHFDVLDKNHPQSES